MVDYSAALPQQQFFQPPDMLQNAMRVQQIQAQGAQMRELARQRSEEEALRGITVDPNSPEYIQQLQRISPKLVFPALTAQRQNIAADRAAEASARQAAVSTAELALKNRELIAKHGEEFQRNLRMVDAYPEDQRPAAYGRLISSLPPDLQTVFPRQYSPNAVRLGMSTTTQLLDAAKPQIQMFGDVPVAVTPATGTFTPLREAGAGAPVAGVGAPVAGASAPAVNNALAARAGAPAAGGEAGYLTGLDRAEGRTKNPYSSADGKFQFINSTFVDTARKTFPELANSSPAEILRLRGVKLGDGRQIEDLLEQTLRANNTQALTSAGIAPTPGNTYLAHFLGAGGARSLLSVDPNTPVSQILDPRAIAANKSVLEGKTAGQVAAWADSKFGGPPGLAASMTAGNQRQAGVGAPRFTPAMGGGMSPTAPTVNNAMTLSLMGQQPPQQGNALAMQAAPMTQLQAAPIAAPQPAPALSAFDSAQQTAPALSPFQQAQKDARDRALVQTEEKTAAMERGKASEKEKTENKARRETAGRVLQVLNDPEIDNLVKNSTSGALEYGLAAAKGAVTGTSTTGMENIGRLATIQEALLFRLANGKLGGGFTDKDSDTIRGMLGRVADPTTPANVRIKTLQDVRAMMTSVATGENMTIAPAAIEEAKPPARRNLKAGDTGAPAGAAAKEINVDDLLKLYSRPK